MCGCEGGGGGANILPLIDKHYIRYLMYVWPQKVWLKF